MVPSLSVSVIIPCFNCADVIARAVESVAMQIRLPSNVFLIDDGSTDGATLKELYLLQDKYIHKLNIAVIALKKNSGPSVARNVGWDLATEPYISFLDADDSWKSCKLELQYRWMHSHPDVVLCGHLCEWEGLSGKANKVPEAHDEVDYTMITKAGLLRRNAFSTPTVMLKRDVPFRFNEGKKHSEDYLLWFQVVCSGYPVARLETKLAVLHKAPFGESGLSADMWAMEKGVQDVFCQLKDEGMLGIGEYCMARLFSLVKYLRRLWMVRWMIRKRKQCR